MAPEVSGAIGRAIRDVRHGKLQLDDVARFFPQLQERAEAYRQDPERIDLREDAIDLSVLKDLLLSGAIPASTGYVMETVPKLVQQAKARVLAARDANESRNSVPVEKVLQLLGQVTDILRRKIPPERHEFVARELRVLGTTPMPAASGR